jgi:hypothetical protein
MSKYAESRGRRHREKKKKMFVLLKELTKFLRSCLLLTILQVTDIVATADCSEPESEWKVPELD